MIKKALLLLLSLGFVLGAHLRPCCDFEVAGQRLDLACTPAAARRAERAAVFAAEEILPGRAELPEVKTHVRLRLKKGADQAPELADGILRATPGVALRETVWAGERCLGAVSDGADFAARLKSYLESTLPSWARGGVLSRPLTVKRGYGRAGFVSTPGDMVLLVTGAVPVIWYDGEGNFATA